MKRQTDIQKTSLDWHEFNASKVRQLVPRSKTRGRFGGAKTACPFELDDFAKIKRKFFGDISISEINSDRTCRGVFQLRLCFPYLHVLLELIIEIEIPFNKTLYNLKNRKKNQKK